MKKEHLESKWKIKHQEENLQKQEDMKEQAVSRTRVLSQAILPTSYATACGFTALHIFNKIFKNSADSCFGSRFKEAHGERGL